MFGGQHEWQGGRKSGKVAPVVPGKIRAMARISTTATYSCDIKQTLWNVERIA